MATNADLIAQLYIGFYDRAPDPIGLQYWIGRLEAGVSIEDIGNSFAASPEASDTYPYFQFPDLLTPDDFLAQVYLNVFGRPIDADGLAYYSARMEAGEPAGVVVASILGNAFTNEGSPDQAYLQNKVDAGLHWSMEAAATNAEIYQENGRLTDQASISSHGVIDGITADPATVGEANAASDAYFGDGGDGGDDGAGGGGGGGVGQTSMLTEAEHENVVGTQGNDTFTGVLDNAGGTFNAGDTVDGAGGTDTLNLIVAGASSLPAGAGISNVEVINFNLTSGASLPALDSSIFAGVQQLWQSDNDGTDNFGDVTVGTGVTAGFRSTGTTAATIAATTVTAADGVHDVAVALDGVLSGSNITLAEATVGDVTSVSVSGSVAATAAPALNTLTLTATTAHVDALYVSLSSDTTVTLSGFNHLDTFDAFGSTGDLTIDLGILDGLASATFGSGNDTLNISAGGFVSGAAPVISNVETINNAAGGTLDLSNITGVQHINSSAAASVYTHASLDTVFGASNTPAIAFADASVVIGIEASITGDNDTLHLALDDNADTVTFSTTDAGGTANSGDIEHITLEANGDLGIAEVMDPLNPFMTSHYPNNTNLQAFTGLESLTVTGAGSVRLTNVQSTAIETFDASTATGDVRVLLYQAADLKTATTGSGNDSIDFDAGHAVVSTGDGNDAVGIGAHSDGAEISTGAGNDFVNANYSGTGNAFTINGGTGADTIYLADNINPNAGGDAKLVYTTPSDSTYMDFDTVRGFAHGDTIDLSAFDLNGEKSDVADSAGTFGGIAGAGGGDGLFDMGGVKYAVATLHDGGNTYVLADLDNDGSFDAAHDLVIQLVGIVPVTAADIVFA